MSLTKNIIFFLGVIFMSAIIFPCAPDAKPYLEARFKAAARCNDEPVNTTSWQKEMNWKALDCTFGLLGETPGFSKAHVIANAKDNTVSLQWLTHVRGGDGGESATASAKLTLEGEFFLMGTAPRNKHLTFLWIGSRDINLPETDPHNFVTAENSFELQGSYYGSLDGLTHLEKMDLSGILSKTSSIKLSFNVTQNHNHNGVCCHGTKEGYIRYHYRIISPETCKTRKHFWNRGYFHKGPIQRLVNIMCVSIGESSRSLNFGKFTHSIINSLETFSNNPGKYPLSSRVAKIRLRRFWHKANKTYVKKYRDRSRQLEKEAANFLDPKVQGSLLSFLVKAHKNFSDKKKRETLLADAVSALSKAASSYASIKNRDSNTLLEIKSISKAMGHLDDLTLDALSEVIISTELVGQEILDQASLNRLEADVLEDQSGK